MTNVRTSVIVDLAGNLPRQVQRYGQSFRSFTRNGERDISRFRRSMASLGRGLDRLGNRYTALLTGAAVAGAVKGVVDFDAQLTRTGTNVNIAAERVEKLKTSLFRVANQKHVRLPVDQLFASVDQFLNKTGDIEFVEKNLDVWGVALQGLGSDAKATGLLMAQFWEKGIRSPDQIMTTLDRIFTQFAKGTVQVGEIAAVSPELFSIVLSKGPAAVNQLGALEQVYAKTAGSAEKAVTSLRATFNVFNDPDKADIIDKMLTQKGFAKARKANGEFRDLHTLLLDIVEISGNNEQVLFKLFGREEALFGLKALMDPQNKKILRDMVEGEIEHGLTLKASAKNANTAKAALQSLKNTYREVADEIASKPIQSLADKFGGDEQEKAKTGIKAGVGVVAGLGAVLLARKLGVGKLLGKLFGKKAPIGGAGLGTLAGGAAGVVPVFVTNMPGSLPGAGGRKGKGGVFLPGGKPAAAKIPKPAGALARGAGLARAIPQVAVAAAAGTAVGSVIYAGLDESKLGHQIGKDMTKLFALFGDKTAQEALASDRRYKNARLRDESNREMAAIAAETKRMSALLQNQFKLDPFTGEIRITVDGPGRVTKLNSNQPAINMEAEQRLGPTMRASG